MTRPDKHAARFGARYRPPLDYRRLAKAVRESLPIIRSITAAMRRVGEGLRDHTLTVVPSRSQPGRLAIVPDDLGSSRVWFAPVGTAAPTLAELEWSPLGYASEDGIIPASHPTDQRPAFWHEPPRVGSTTGRLGGRIGPPADILDRIDDTLLTYDAQRATGEQPWPYRGF